MLSVLPDDDTLERLQFHLREARQRPSTDLLYRLLHELNEIKPYFLDLFQFTPLPSAEAQTQPTTDEQRVARKLNVSASIAAHLLQLGAKYAGELVRSVEDSAVLTYFNIRRHILNCLLDVALIAYDEDMADNYSSAFSSFLDDIWTSPTPEGDTFLRLILKLLDRLNLDLFSMAIEDRMGISAATEHALKQELTVQALHQRMLQQQHENLSAAVCVRLFEERSALVRFMVLVCWNRPISTQQLLQLTQRLQTWLSSDPITPLIVGCVLNAVDLAIENASTEGEHKEESREALADLLKTCHPLFHTESQWKDHSLFYAVKMLWNIFARRSVDVLPSLERELAVSQPNVEEVLEECFEKGSLEFIRTQFLSFVPDGDDLRGDYDTSTHTTVGVFLEEDIDYAKVFVCTFVKSAILYIASRLVDFIRKLKSKEEEASTAGLQARRKTILVQETKFSSPGTQQHAIESLLNLIAITFRSRPIEGLELLDVRRRSFLKLIYDDRMTVSAKRAFFDMLASLANDEQGAQSVYELMAGFSSALSWEWIFGGLDWYTSEFTHVAERGTVPEISSDDLALLRALLMLLRNVSKYSLTARITFTDSFDALQRIFGLLGTRIPKDLKGPLFAVIESFCFESSRHVQDATNGASTIVWHVWNNLESMQVVPRSMHGGILYDIDMIESLDETYPETRSFIRLLCTLTHPRATDTLTLLNVQQLPQLNANLAYDYTNTIALAIPDPLFLAGTFTEQAVPFNRYIQYVVQEILLKAKGRAYCFSGECWKVIDLCLDFCERCLYSFEIRTIREFAVTGIEDAELVKIYSQPGFQIMVRLLSGGILLKEIFQYLDESVDAVNCDKYRTRAFLDTVKRSLRILLRAFDLQDVFFDFLFPRMKQSGNVLFSQGLGTNIYARLDEFLLRSPKTVVNIVDYVNCVVDEEVVLLSVLLTSQFGVSPLFADGDISLTLENRTWRQTDLHFSSNRLVSILDRSAEINRIIAGYVNRLNMEDPSTELELESLPDENPAWANWTRFAIVEMFTRNLRSGLKPPTLSHLLLGYNMQNVTETEFRHPRDWPADVQKTCFYTLLELISEDITSHNVEDVITNLETADQLFSIRHPILCCKILQIFVFLATNTLTSAATMRFLRYGEDFFYRCYLSLPSELVPATIDDQETMASLLHPLLEQRVCLLKLLSLELHLSHLHNEERHAKRLVHLIFNIPSSETTFEDWSRLDTEGYPKILELFDTVCSIEVEGYPDPAEIVSNSKSFQEFPFPAYYTATDYDSISIFDTKRMYSGLRNYYFRASGVNRVTDEVQVEIDSILQDFYIYNSSTFILYARQQFMQAWSQTIVSVLCKLTDQIKLEHQERLLFTILNCVFPKLAEDGLLRPQECCSLSEIVMVACSKLSQDRLYIDLTVSSRTISTIDGNQTVQIESLSLPSEQLIQFFSMLLASIRANENSLLTRGNLYTGLLFYLRYIQPSLYEKHQFNHWINAEPDNFDMQSVTGTVLTTLTSLSDTPLTVKKKESSQRRQLMAAVITLFKQNAENVLSLLCRDASAETGNVWQTVALVTLDALMGLIRRSSSNDVILDYFKSRNYLRHFIDEIRTVDDKQLISAMSSSYDTSAIFIFESKMSLLLRLAQTAQGAQALLDARFFESISDVAFLRLKSESHGFHNDVEGFGSTRYHQTIQPVFSIINAVLSSVVDRGRVMAIRKVSDFVRCQQVVFFNLLRVKTNTLTLSRLKEIESISVIFYSLAQERDLLDRTGPEPLHFLLMQALELFTTPEEWIKRVNPATEEEIIKSTRRDRSQSLISTPLLHMAITPQQSAKYQWIDSTFGREVLQIVQAIVHNLLSYCIQVCSATTPDQLLPKDLFSPSFVHKMYDRERKSHSALPPIGCILHHLKFGLSFVDGSIELLTSLSSTLRRILELTETELDELLVSLMNYNKNSVRLTADEKQRLVTMQLHQTHDEVKQRLNVVLEDVEMALYLILRHLESFFNRDDYDDEELERLQHDAASLLTPELERIPKLPLNKDLLGLSYKSRSNFLNMLVRYTSRVIQLKVSHSSSH